MKIQIALIALMLPALAFAQEAPTDATAVAEPAAETTTTTDETKPAEPAAETATTEAASDAATTETPTETAATPAETPTEASTETAETPETPTEAPVETPTETSAETTAGDGVSTTLSTAPSNEIQRSGLYFGFGLAWALSNLADEGIGPASGDFWLRMGWAINSQILVGGEFALLGNYNAWEEQEVAGAMMSSVMATGMYFPMADIPLSVSAGLGWGSNLHVQRLANSSDDNPLAHGNGDDGVSFMAAVGYDLGAGPGANFGFRLRWDGAYLADAGMVSNIGLGVALNFY